MPAPPRLLINHIKNGPPRDAVITPTGISFGYIALLAKVSHIIKKIPPAINDIGNRRLWHAPKIRRKICGIISPTNPMIPESATADAVSRDAVPRIINDDVLGEIPK